MLVAIARHIVQWAPDPAAYVITRALTGRVHRPDLMPEQERAIREAKEITYGPRGRGAAWSWGEGPLVVLVHGWSGCAAQMAPLAAGIARAGFQAVAIDVHAHGRSPGRRAHWKHFLADIASVAPSLGKEAYAYVGHSAGGLCAMAARRLRRIRAERYVCVCAPSYPFPPIERIKVRLGPSAGVLARYRRFIARQFETTWEALEDGYAWAGAGTNLLLFYEKNDRFLSHTEGDRILSFCPEARLVKSEGYGHQRVLSAPELATAVLEFLKRTS